MKFDDIMRAVLNVFPDAEIAEDLNGQLVVYTGLEYLKSDDVWVYVEETDT